MGRNSRIQLPRANRTQKPLGRSDSLPSFPRNKGVHRYIMDNFNKQPTVVDLLSLQRVPIAHQASQSDGGSDALMDV